MKIDGARCVGEEIKLTADKCPEGYEVTWSITEGSDIATITPDTENTAILVVNTASVPVIVSYDCCPND